jgi:N-methylhydantoinase A
MTYVAGIDIGGTFTDAFVTDEAGDTRSVKTPSTPPDFARGVIAAVEELAADLGIGSDQLLRETIYVCHGTTAALNALVTGATAEVGFLTTRGHADSISIMNLEGRYAGLGPEEIQNLPRTNKPPPLVPRRRVREIDERVDHKGAVIVPLDEQDVRGAVEELVAEGVEAIAVSYLWSFEHPEHELRTREIIHEIAPDLYVGLSSELSPRIREYPRAATTIMSTQVGPPLRHYLTALERQLREMGFGGALLVMQGSGGTISAADAASRAITTVGSVLTGGVVGCVNLGSSLGHDNVISTDMGGTTFLVGMVVKGKPVTSTSTVINQHVLNLPMVRINSIGAGGGAIAWLDAGGNLKVGPRSAGARPGPACYGEGGEEPTVTDADLVLGILDPDFFLGGRKRLEPELARSAIERRIAEPLGMDVEEAATAIYAIENAQTADLTRRVVVNAGHDPRDFALYSFGGAGPVHCASYAADLGVREILVPLGNTAATFSAYGLAASDVVASAELSRPTNFPIPGEDVGAAFAQLEDDVRRQLDAQELRFESVTLQRSMDIRFTLQLAEVETPVKNGELTDADVAQIANDFERLYEQLYGEGSGFREAGLQAITYRVLAVGELPFSPRLPEIERRNGSEPEVKSVRRVLLDPQAGWAETPIYDYGSLRAGHEIAGPAVIEAPTTTVAVPAGTHGAVDELGNVIMRFV